MKFQKALVDDLEAMGVKQVKVAEVIGVGNSSVSRVFKMKRKLTVDEFCAICEFFGLSIDGYLEKVNEQL